MKKHLALLVLIVFLLLLAATAWVGADWLRKMDSLSRAVISRAEELNTYVHSKSYGAGAVHVEFQPDMVRTPIEQTWDRGIPVTDYPPAILRLPQTAEPRPPQTGPP